MSIANEIRSAASIAEDRIALASTVIALRDEILAAPDDVRAEKSADLQAANDRLEACDKEYYLVKAVENANAMIESLSAKPQRPQPTYKAATIDRRSGQVIDGGDLASLTDAEAVSSRDYSKAFEGLLEARGNVDRVTSRNHRDMLERYGKGGDRNLGWNEFFIPFSKAMTLASSTNGSNAVAPDFRFDVITQRSVTPKALQLCRVITTNVSQVTFPKNTDTNTDSGRVGTIGTNNRPTKGESPTATAIDTGPFSQLTITAKTGTMVQDISADFFQDAPGMSSYLQQESSKLFANRIDKEVFSATTLSDSLEAILANTGIGTQLSGTSASLGTDNAKVYDNMADLFFSFKESYASNLSWVMNRATHGKLYKVKDSQGLPLLSAFQQGTFSNSPSYQMFGIPVSYVEYMPASGAANARSILIGDFQEYYLLVRQGFTVIIDDMSKQGDNLIRLNYKYRIGGAVRDASAFASIKEAVS